MIEIRAIGGYGEIGRNMTAVRIDDDVFILDMGLMLDKYIALTENDELVKISAKKLMEGGAAPDIGLLGDWKPLVKAIIIGHAHLDHLGAVPFLASKFSCPIYGSPYTIAVLRAMLKDDHVRVDNRLESRAVNTIFSLTKNIKAEFINVTHSIPDTVMIALHTPLGSVLYGNDFKLDEHPTLGKPTNIKRLKELQVHTLILDTLYASKKDPVDSESFAAEELARTFQEVKGSRAIMVTTFASHIARLRTIVSLSRQIGRTPVLMGRSMAKYIDAAADVGIANFDDAELVQYSSAVRRWLKKVRNLRKYVFVVTGHQGEPKAVLRKIVQQNMLPLDQQDAVIFSCTVIPTNVNRRNREDLEAELAARKVQIIKDVHVSGHGSLVDQEMIVRLLKPKVLVPSHADEPNRTSFITMAKKYGYVEGKTIHRLMNGDTLRA